MANVAALRDEVPGFDDSVSFEWEGATVIVKPIRKWKESAKQAVKAYDFSTWARTSLDEESYAHFLAVDPDLDQCNDLFEAWNEIVGIDPKAPAASVMPTSSRGSSRSTARR